jgi:hypothetical protein
MEHEGVACCSHLLTLVPRSRIFCTLKMEAIRSSETSVHTRFIRRCIPEDGILHNHRRETPKSYISDKCLPYGLYYTFRLNTF